MPESHTRPAHSRLLGFGMSLLLDSELLLGVAVTGGDVAIIRVAASALLNFDRLRNVPIIGASAATMGARRTT
jgi:hypothetical protein